MPIRSSILTKVRGNAAFSLASTEAKPSNYWLEAIMLNLEKQPYGDDLALNVAIDEALVLWDAIDRKSVARFKNFHSLSSTEQDRHPSKVAYYLGNAFKVFALRCPHKVSCALCQILVEGNDDFSFYLTDSVIQVSFQVVFEVFIRFMESDKLDFVKKIVAKYPSVVNSYFCFGEQRLILTPLAYALHFQKAEFIDYFLEHTNADVNAQVVIDLSYGSIPILFLALTEKDYYFTTECLFKFGEHPAFRPEMAIDSHGFNSVYYAIEKKLHLSGFEYLIRYYDWQRPFDSASSLCDAFTYAMLKGETHLASMITFHPDFNYAKVDEQGQTYLMIAARNNVVDTVIELLREGKKQEIYQLTPGFTCYTGESALTGAISFKAYNALELLVKEASEHEINCASGINPLALAICLHDEQAVSIILNHPQISLDIPVWTLASGLRLIDYAMTIGDSEIIKRLQERIPV